MTHPDNYESKAVAIRDTWGKRCDKLIFMSTKEDKELGAVDLGVSEGRKNLWAKTKTAFKYLYDNHLDEYDWFWKADDDTYVIVENLRYMLTPYDPNFPIALGERYHRSGRKNYLTGGRCMTNADILLGDSRDENGKGRFFQLTIEGYISGQVSKRYPSIAKYPTGEGIDCISPTAVSFHKMKDISMIYALDFFIHRLQVYGFEREFVEERAPAPLPPDVGVIPLEVLKLHGHPLFNDSSMVQTTEKTLTILEEN